jgi:hypothetical protein
MHDSNLEIRQTKGTPQVCPSLPGNLKQAYGDWFRTFRWDWFVTLTFGCELRNKAAEMVLVRFVDELEQKVKAPISYLAAREEGSYSGCGKPAIRVHFHLLVGCAAPLTASTISDLWNLPRFGGKRVKGASAHVVPYDPLQGAAYYCFKHLSAVKKDNNDDDWSEHHLELVSLVRPASYATSAKTRQRWKRQQQRYAAMDKVVSGMAAPWSNVNLLI